MDEKKRALLLKLEEELQDYDDTEKFSLFTKEELDAPMDVLRGLHTEFGSELIDVLGEYFFMPFEAEEILYFTTVFTISEDIPDEAIEELAASVARINCLMPCGCFAIGGTNDHTLLYRYSVPVIASHSEEAQFEVIMAGSDAAFITAERYVGFLMLVVEGKLSMSEMLNALSGGE